tara:strand:+ start:22440 stop:24887 length:2448 start_codon:yes stop_codon:yes gene_type:complete
MLSFLFSQNSDFMVSKIIINGNNEISDQDIISLSGLNIKKSITAVDIQNAIKRLWLVDKFKDIQIDVDETYKGIDLYIRIVEHSKLNKIILSGSYFDFQFLKFKKSKSKLLNLLSIKEGDILTDQNIKNSIQILADDFSKRNFHNADISYELKKSKVSNTENLLIKINANKKSRIKDISLKLNGEEIKSSSLLIRFKNLILNKSNELDKNTLIKNLDKIKKWKWYLPWRGKYDDSKLNDMENNLILFFKSLGYLNFKIINYEVIDNKLTIDIETGNKFKVNNISFNGNYIFADSTLQSNLKLVKGKTFNGKSYEISNLNLNTLYRDKGYLFAEIIPSLIPVGKDSVNLNFTINEKSIAKVKKIIIKGNLKTEDNIIRRDIDIFPGETFSQTAIMKSAQKLYMLNYFENIIPDVKQIGDGEVDLVFEVVEKNSGQLNFSAGYSGVYGFTGGGGFTFPNFLGKGKNISFNYQRGLSSNQQSNVPVNNFSQEVNTNQQFSFSFIEPRLFNTSNLVGISFNYSERGQSSTYSMPFDSKSFGGGLRIGRKFNWPDDFFKGTWMLSGSQREYFSSEESDLLSYYSNSIQDYINYKNGKYVFSTSGVSIKQTITRDNRDHPEFPTKGSHFNWTFTYSGGLLGGDEDYYKNEVGFKWYNKIVDKLVVHQNFKFGALNEIEVNSGRSVVPPSARFLMGGTGMPYGEMLRGYAENMIGPLGASFPKGGNIMLKYSLEIRYLISENPNLYILAFTDAGNVWNTLNVVDPFSLRRSIGIGARVMMPMLGMIGYDIAYGFDPSVQEYLSGNNSAHGWEYHFIFGLPIY